MQLTLLNWDNESVLALNKKMNSELEISVFYLVPKHFRCPNWVKSIAHDPALNLPKNPLGNTLVHIPLI